MIYGRGWRMRSLRRELRLRERFARTKGTTLMPAVAVAVAVVVGLAYLLTFTWVALFARVILGTP